MFNICDKRFYVYEELADEDKFESYTAAVICFKYNADKSYKYDNELHIVFSTDYFRYVEDLQAGLEFMPCNIEYKNFCKIITKLDIDESHQAFNKEYGKVFMMIPVKHTSVSRYPTLHKLIQHMKRVKGQINIEAEFNRKLVNQMNVLNYCCSYGWVKHIYSIFMNMEDNNFVPVIYDTILMDKGKVVPEPFNDVCRTIYILMDMLNPDNNFYGIDLYGLRLHIIDQSEINFSNRVGLELHSSDGDVKEVSFRHLASLDKDYEGICIKGIHEFPFSIDDDLKTLGRIEDDAEYGERYDEFIKEFKFKA